MKAFLAAVVVAVIAAGVVGYNFTTFFVVQPIGALPEGVTLWVWRGEKMRFFESPDGLCLRTTGGVSLLCRMTALAAVVGKRDRIIARLPYSERVYLSSTDGQTFDRWCYAIFLIAIFIGLIPAGIASNKGHSFFLWWVYGAALFIVAFPHSLFLTTDSKVMERRALADPGNRKCPHCAEVIKAEAKVCKHCGRDVAQLEIKQPPYLIKETSSSASADRVPCPKCGRQNDLNSALPCHYCGADLRSVRM